MLKYRMDSMDGVHEEVAKLYTKNEDGGFYLTEVAGVAPNKKVDEFRDKNIELIQSLDKFKGIDPENVKTMQTTINDLNNKLAKNKDIDVDAVVEERVKTMREAFETENNQLKETVTTQNRTLESLLIDNNVRAAAVSHGIAETAFDDVILRAKTVFKVDQSIL